VRVAQHFKGLGYLAVPGAIRVGASEGWAHGSVPLVSGAMASEESEAIWAGGHQRWAPPWFVYRTDDPSLGPR
jgi:hypothetical protein